MTDTERARAVVEDMRDLQSIYFVDEFTAIIAQALRDVREADARVAEDPASLDHIGGSTGNAYGTAKRIAAAIRALNEAGGG